MRIKILTLSLIFLGFSLNIQAQNTANRKSLMVSQEVKSQPKTPSQQTKENIRRRNMAKYKAMSQKSKKRTCLLYTSPSPRDATLSRMPSSA